MSNWADSTHEGYKLKCLSAKQVTIQNNNEMSHALIRKKKNTEELYDSFLDYNPIRT